MIVAALALAAVLEPTDAPAVVSRLYEAIVRYQPIGIPTGEARKALWPLLSTRLRRSLGDARGCELHYAKLHPHSDEKPEYGWLEAGLFSGFNERATPHAAEVVQSEDEGRGRTRVYVVFTYRDPNARLHPNLPAEYQWHGAAVVTREYGRFSIDDFLTFEDDSLDVAGDLEDVLAGCTSGRWVGLEGWTKRPKR